MIIVIDDALKIGQKGAVGQVTQAKCNSAEVNRILIKLFVGSTNLSDDISA